MSRFLAVLSLALLAACVVLPAPDATPIVPHGKPVALGQRVAMGELAVMPTEVIEDSRCPIDARCVWAGRLVVRTRIEGAGWRDTADIQLGQPYSTHGKIIALVSGEPGNTTERRTRPEDYRFIYDAGRPDAANPGSSPG